MADAQQEVSIGGSNVLVTDGPYGMKFFRQSASDELVSTCLIDHLGRERVVDVPITALLIMVPTGEFGAIPFDPASVVMPDGSVGKIQDAEGRPCFMQRAVLNRSEVFTMIQQVLEKERSGIVVPSQRDVMKLVKP